MPGSDVPDARGGHAAELADGDTEVRPDTPTEGEFVALTYNVHGLPDPITGNDTSARLEALAPMLAPFGVVGLQEDFLEDEHQVVAELAGHPFRTWFEDVLDDRAFGSGLSLFSRPEHVAVHTRHYDTCHGRYDHGSDCLASKGVQMVRIRLAPSPGAEIDVYNTHLDAGGSPGDREAREQQIGTVLSMIAEHSAGRAVVLLGDTNLHADREHGAAQLDRLLQEAGLSDACEATGCPEPNHIDRILFRSGERLRLRVERWRRESSFVDERGRPLSDHPALSATLRWELRSRTGR